MNDSKMINIYRNFKKVEYAALISSITSLILHFCTKIEFRHEYRLNFTIDRYRASQHPTWLKKHI